MATIKAKIAAKVKDTANDDEGVTPIRQHVGDLLREAREARKLTVDDIANELMIRRFYLEAMENGQFRDLPERVYATGFVRSYAQYMNLDPTEVTNQFKREAYGSQSSDYRVELTMPEPAGQSVAPSRTAVLCALAALFVIALGIFWATRDNKPATTSIPAPPVAADMAETPTSSNTVEQVPSPDAFQAEVTPSDQTGFAAAPSSTASPTSVMAQDNTVFLEALQASWVEVKDAKGVMLFTNILKQGQKLPLPQQSGLTLTTGNAGGLRMVIGGQPQNPLGRSNEVKRNIPLSTTAAQTKR